MTLIDTAGKEILTVPYRLLVDAEQGATDRRLRDTHIDGRAALRTHARTGIMPVTECSISLRLGQLLRPARC